MFKYNNRQYVIEFQCSPISSEYLERHDLYEAGGIKDIWILGTEKYSRSNGRTMVLKKNSFCHLDVNNNSILRNYKFYNLSALYFIDGEMKIKASNGGSGKASIPSHEDLTARKKNCAGLVAKIFEELTEHYIEAKQSTYQNNCIEIGAFNIYISFDYGKDLCCVEIKKRCFNKVTSRYWNGQKMVNKNKWEFSLQSKCSKYFKCSTIDSEKISQFILEFLDKYKGVDSQ